MLFLDAKKIMQCQNYITVGFFLFDGTMQLNVFLELLNWHE